MQPFPNITSPLVGTAQRILKPWIQYFQQFTNAPAAASRVSLGVSPFSYTAVEPGNLIVSGGTVSKINLIRGNVIIDVTGIKIIPLSINDNAQIVYSVAPSINFLPSYGANTTS